MWEVSRRGPEISGRRVGVVSCLAALSRHCMFHHSRREVSNAESFNEVHYGYQRRIYCINIGRGVPIYIRTYSFSEILTFKIGVF